MILKDRINTFPSSGGNWSSGNNSSGNNSNFSSGTNNQQGSPMRKNTDPCRRYNHNGKCKFGVNCHFDHKCSYCFKFGHMVMNCRKLIADRERMNSNKTGAHKSNGVGMPDEAKHN